MCTIIPESTNDHDGTVIFHKKSQACDPNDPEIKKVKAEILLEWDDKRDRSCDLGTMVHLYLEQKFSPNLDIEVVEDIEALLRIEKFESLITPRMKDFISISQELRIFSHSLKISGTIDIAIIIFPIFAFFQTPYMQ